MHELSIAQSICEIALESLQQHPGHVVSKIGLKIGALSDVMPDALDFGFEVSKKEYGLADAQLIIEAVPARGKCRSCGAEFDAAGFRFICPKCDSIGVDLLSGQEMEISHLELTELETGLSRSGENRMVSNAKS